MNTLAEYTKGKCSFTNITVRSLETEWLKEKKKKKKQKKTKHGSWEQQAQYKK